LLCWTCWWRSRISGSSTWSRLRVKIRRFINHHFTYAVKMHKTMLAINLKQSANKS
jgi:hypothetical protein